MIGRIVCITLIVAAGACGGSSSSNPHTDSGTKMDSSKPIDAVGMYDFGCGGSTACTTDKICCATPGSPTTFACADTTACPAQDKITCDGPDECGGTTPVCCGVYVADGTGTYPKCGISALGTSCTNAAACPTHLGQTCSDTTKVQICHVSSDCTDAQSPKCCTFMSSGAQLTFCTDSLTAAAGGATCHP